MSNSATYETIRKELQQISVVDTHEHFCFPPQCSPEPS